MVHQQVACHTSMSHLIFCTHMSHGIHTAGMWNIHESLNLSYTNESMYIKRRMSYMLSHGTHEWVMAHTNESWHTRMSHGTHVRHAPFDVHWWIRHRIHFIHTSHGYIQKRHVIYKWDIESTLYTWVMAHTKQACHTYISHWIRFIWMSHGTCKGVCHTYVRHPIHFIRMSHGTHKGGVSYINDLSNPLYTNESWHT